MPQINELASEPTRIINSRVSAVAIFTFDETIDGSVQSTVSLQVGNAGNGPGWYILCREFHHNRKYI